MSDGHSVPADCYAGDELVHWGPMEPVGVTLQVRYYRYAGRPDETWAQAVGLADAVACGATPGEAKRRLVAWLESRARQWEAGSPMDCADVGES